MEFRSDHKYEANPDELRITFPPWQKVLDPLLVIVGCDGIALTVASTWVRAVSQVVDGLRIETKYGVLEDKLGVVKLAVAFNKLPPVERSYH